MELFKIKSKSYADMGNKNRPQLAYVGGNWKELIGNGAYISKPNTPLTNEWYNEMIALLEKSNQIMVGLYN